MGERILHPKRGPHQPHAGTPDRRPASVRRTTSQVARRPEGVLGPVHVLSAGRDLWTSAAGATRMIAEASVEAEFSLIEGSVLRSLTVTPGDDRFAGLVGRSVSSGFRRSLADLAGADDQHDEDRDGEDRDAEDRARSLRYQLLDDFGTVGLLAGFPIAAAGIHPPKGQFHVRDKADVCAGWATGATILVEGEELGYPPEVTGPPAPAVLSADPDGWHPIAGAGPHSMRRLRRIDVWPAAAEESLEVEAFFRDSHIDAEGDEWVVHEYLVRAMIDRRTGVFRSIHAEIGVLPWVECPGAVASAGRLAGTHPADLRDRVRREFVGPSTCTHLNDTMRSLAALPFLARQVEAGATLQP
ncbi:MAG TPA: DUF2889 domain-containing protein [Acidimicrobiales bacterium]|nr:DUF2889 domain-containing protein [Acidimicrobiales bacterium]